MRAAGVETVALPTAYRQWAGRRIALPYVNLYFGIGIGVAIVPLAVADTDATALAGSGTRCPNAHRRRPRH